MRRAAAPAAALALALAGCGGPPALDGPTFQDAFARDTGWPSGPRIGVEDGRLRLRAVAAREYVYGALPSMERDLRNMVVEAQVRVEAGAVAGAGVTCRTGSDVRSPELYAFIVTADGAAQILRSDRRGLRTLAQGEAPGGGAAVRRGVTVRASCLRGDVTMSVDGREVLRASDRGVREGRAGVVLLAGTDPRPVASFDDLRVRTGV